eukprot:Pgem_evm1s11063
MVFEHITALAQDIVDCPPEMLTEKNCKYFVTQLEQLLEFSRQNNMTEDLQPLMLQLMYSFTPVTRLVNYNFILFSYLFIFIYLFISFILQPLMLQLLYSFTPVTRSVNYN